MRTFLASFLLALSLFPVFAQVFAQEVNAPWVPDQGDGTYRNPVIFADYSDPDVCRVGDDYYLTASSFNCIPGLPILHSTDLVNWELIGYALDHLSPREVYDQPDHGNGVWAPAIRHHQGRFYIYYGDPNYGIFMLSAESPAGPWTEPHLVQGGRGWIDPCPFWDDDGNAYLVHAWAGSRAGIKSVLMMRRMSADGKQLIGDPVMIFDGHEEHGTVEGPKMYQANGWYYVFAPAGGVATGWQLVLRARQPFGPYEWRTVLAQGETDINGPHQGAWVDTPLGEHWFIHFQDLGAYGRVVHLQPMTWQQDGWPVIGADPDGDGVGEPVQSYRKPAVVSPSPVMVPATSDAFDSAHLGRQWQWHANPHPKWGYASGHLGYLRLNARPLPEGIDNLWPLPNMLLQKFPAEAFTATTKLDFHPNFDGERVGLIVMGRRYAYLSLGQEDGNLVLQQRACPSAETGGAEVSQGKKSYQGHTIYLRVTVEAGAVCRFSYSEDGKKFQNIGEPFTAQEGKWIGAKVGFFCTREGVINDAGYADVDWFRIE
jgi:beta-xylosidase